MGGFQDLLWISGLYSQHFVELCQWQGAGYECVRVQLWHQRSYPGSELWHHIGRHWRWSKKWSYLHLCYNTVQWWAYIAYEGSECMSSALCEQSHFLLHTQLGPLREDSHRILCMGSSVQLFYSLWWWVGVSFVLSLSRCTDWRSTVSLTNMTWPCLHNAETVWLYDVYILVHICRMHLNWWNSVYVGVLCAVVLALMHEVVNLKLLSAYAFLHSPSALTLKCTSWVWGGQDWDAS